MYWECNSAPLQEVERCQLHECKQGFFFGAGGLVCGKQGTGHGHAGFRFLFRHCSMGRITIGNFDDGGAD